MIENKRSLSKKSIIRLAILGIILFLGTGLSGGIQLYRQNIKVYSEAAFSYVNMLLYQTGGVDITGILDHQDEIRDIRKKFYSYIHGVSVDFSFDDIEKEAGTETMKIYDQWEQVDSFVLGFGNLCKDIKYAYVVIPTEKDLIYVWDSDLSGDDYTLPFEHAAFTDTEEEHIMKLMGGDLLSDFFIENVDGELLGTSLSPMYDSDNNVCAVAAIDISVSSIRTACLRLLLHMGIIILLIMLISITIYHYVIRKQIIQPIVTLTRAADGLVNNLRKDDSKPFSVDVHTGDEIDVLARSFEEMDAKLQNYIRENAAITAEKERIVTELSLAARIQADMLPSVFPPFPDVKEIDLYASMDPAKEVGGDFYDFFMIGEDRLGVVMADVSGKGIPAALFMMMSKIMLHNFALTLEGPEAILEKVNDQICLNTTEEMFVTVWLGVLDLKTGLLTAANAGHEYPLLKKPGGDFELIKDKHGFVIGGIEGYHYAEYQIQLMPGTRLFLYTDGLPESTDAENQMFGIERVLRALNDVKDESCREILEYVSQSAASFVGSAPQFDDTTMLCLDYYGNQDS